jgi:hypothetical protein
MKRSSIFICLILLGLGQYASANVLINEIAWMGTTNSANAEWMELYNDGTDSVAMDGWSLTATDGSPSIQLSGTISAQGYFLLERTSDESVPGITASQIYSGSLGNSGEHLVLKDNLGATIDDVDSTGGWPAGDNTSKQTMQRNGSAWITADGTPGIKNSITQKISASSTNIVSSTTSSTSSVTITTQKADDSNQEDIVQIAPDPKYTAKMSIPDFATAGTAITLSSIVKQNSKRDMVTGKFRWYLGDGSSYFYTKNTAFDHVFYYPGDYTIVLEYYSNYFKEEPDSLHKKIITIVPASISITGILDDGGLVFQNSATKDIDLNGWEITVNNHAYRFPKYTIIPKSGILNISSHTIGFKISTDDRVVLKNPYSIEITRFPVQKGTEL